MRHVHDTSMVGHLWANQSQADARNKQGNFSFRGPSIFSYAAEIARHVQVDGNRAVMVSAGTWSVTTSGHQSLVRRSLGKVQVFHVADLDSTPDAHDRNFIRYAETIHDELGKAKRARKYRDSYLGSVLHVAEEANAYAAFFGLSWRLGGNLEEVEAQRAAYAAAKAEREAEEQRRADERLAVAVEQWKAGENVQIGRASVIYMRLREEDGTPFVETSRGARFPVEDAAKAWKLIGVVRQRGEGWERNGHMVRMGSFQLDAIDSEGNVKAGCHSVRFEESERLAKLLGLTGGNVRDWECYCGHKFTAPVVISESTQRLSGEASVYCPQCGKKPLVGSPVHSEA